ncbi:MAG: hypothetical protein HKN76_20275 [Saprospiraceae bacterium]|nr:hypothetical protein [Saprospiraceae bacterium]
MKRYLLLFLSCFIIVNSFAQDESYEEDTYYDQDYSGDEYYDEAEELSEDLIRNSEFFIPSSPAFTLLGATPEMVTRPGTVQDFKVDWRIKNYNLAPDLALEMQPLWALYYDWKGLDAYRQATPFMKTLSTLSLSFGTAKLDGINHFSYGIKMNLFREKDPVSDPVLLREMAIELAEMEGPLRERIKDLRAELDTTESKEERMLIREELFSTRGDIASAQRAQKSKLIEVQANYMTENWNSSGLDFAFGKVFTYNNDLDTLNLQNAGYALWLNGAIKSGHRGLIGGIIRLKKVGVNQDFMTGVSYHFGGARFSFYTELVYESLQNFSDSGFSEDELFAAKYAKDLDIGWLQFNEPIEAISRITLSYGGDFRLSNGILLNFSLRTQLDEKIKFKKLLPVANVTCLMR